MRTLDGGSAWLVTRHEDVRKIMSDPRMSADRHNPGLPPLMRGQRKLTSRVPKTMTGMDAPEHTRARQAVLPEFTAKRVNRLKPRIQQIVDECLATMLDVGPPVDIVETLALPLPSRVSCEMLGVPYAEHHYFEERISRLSSQRTPDEERTKAHVELQDFVADLVRQKEKNPTDDLLGRQIIRQRVEEGRDDHEAIVALAFLLVLAANETTAGAIALGVLAFLQHPGQLAAIRHEPGLIPGAVNEVFRYFTIGDVVTSRVATEDVRLGDVVIRAGEGVLLSFYAANRDPDAYDHPDEFDIWRDARHHLTFGFGPHMCLGITLARIELAIVFETLFRRIPDLRLATPLADIPFKEDATIYGIHELRVTW
ncbi:cytochrome P450 [Saccharopolyspora shandongensis]|uniref:cytochrome P450 n=1 Tax=Saccharopolyspora shandongensis TaxID=418495 RepID=UPI0033D4B8A6